MSYTALYRKFRPSGFDEVKGQDQIVTTLRNQIKTDRIGHAYLFCGTRGTGKTSVAKIMAKAVNCESQVDGICPIGTAFAPPQHSIIHSLHFHDLIDLLLNIIVHIQDKS